MYPREAWEKADRIWANEDPQCRLIKRDEWNLGISTPKPRPPPSYNKGEYVSISMTNRNETDLLATLYGIPHRESVKARIIKGSDVCDSFVWKTYARDETTKRRTNDVPQKEIVLGPIHKRSYDNINQEYFVLVPNPTKEERNETQKRDELVWIKVFTREVHSGEVGVHHYPASKETTEDWEYYRLKYHKWKSSNGFQRRLEDGMDQIIYEEEKISTIDNGSKVPLMGIPEFSEI